MFKLAHIIITGPSGSGKSTLAKKIAKERNLSFISIDDYPEWTAFMRDKPNREKNYNTITEQLVNKALKEPGEKVIEGAQFLRGLKEIPKEHEVILVDPGKRKVLKQRLDRSIKEGKEKGKTIDRAFLIEKKKIGRKLYDEAYSDIIRLGLK